MPGWRAAGRASVARRRGRARGGVVNPATGVLARYYHRYAQFLSRHGFHALTYDYRGIGASRPPRLRGCGYRWRDWGMLDFDAALRFLCDARHGMPLHVVGHSIGGFLPGYAEAAPALSRILTVGAQYAYWRDYAAHRRLRLLLKWHVAMPMLTAALGYFQVGGWAGWRICRPASPMNGAFVVLDSRLATKQESGPRFSDASLR
ncbi:alpha/beta fold hydrolase [Roseococcus sp. SYP-B2431]|uniref:alpha/beta fold hydrolase n=1 Tax=Roseococcus sp. SYP-B2431 TaxID=2496640 RepID=UPI001F110E49|nr:alpha/beta fold hydrolase [Roseococcus sp. SYP-B2431]